jgi:hypothetical protein
MARHPLDDQIDRLYQLPLDEFTTARNALAKEAGTKAPDVKRLEKPNIAAWAVNQLFWRARKTYDELIAASERLRTAYRQQLAGKPADVRGLEAAHRDAVRKATQAAREILDATGDKASEAVMAAVRETLDILPSSDPPGRLTKSLKRTGFEALEGFTISAKPKQEKPKPQPARTQPPARTELTDKQRRANEGAEREREMTRERLRFAEAAEREAEAALGRARRAVERTDNTRQRLEQELDEATKAAKDSRKAEAASQAAYDKAVAERERLAKKAGGTKVPPYI